MSTRVPDDYFETMYADAEDPWRLAERWYEQRKYAITVGMLPHSSFRHAFEPGCSVGVLTELLARRCEHVTAIDVVASAVAASRARLGRAGLLDRVALAVGSLDDKWPADVDLVVLSEVAYYLDADVLRDVLDRECGRLASGATVIAAHWRHPVADYPLTGDEADAAIAATSRLHRIATYLDDDVVISVLTKDETGSVATLSGVPGAPARPVSQRSAAH